MLVFAALAHFTYYFLVLYSYIGSLVHRSDPPTATPPTDPNNPAAGASWSWLGVLFSPLGDSAITVVDRSPQLSFIARPGTFGGRITEEDGSLLGYAIPLDAFTASPAEGNACPPTTVLDGHNVPDQSESWIALIQRGGCGFAAKVQTAQDLGARAVVVGNSEPNLDAGERDTLVQMYAPGSSGNNISIPSTFVTFATYTRLLHLIEKSNTTTSGYKTLSLALHPEVSGWEWPILTFLALLLLPSLLTILTLLLHRVRVARAEAADRAPEDLVFNLPWRVWGERGLLGEPEDAEDGVEKPDDTTPPAPTAATDDAVSRADAEQEDGVPTSPVVSGGVTEARESPSSVVVVASPPTSPARQISDPFSPSTSQNDFVPSGPPPAWFASQTQCAICLGDFERGDRVRILPCRHVFHLEEVDAWLISRKKVCPICKADVTAHLVPRRRELTGWRGRLRSAVDRVRAMLPEGVQTGPTTERDENVERGYGSTGITTAEDERWMSISERLERQEQGTQQDQQHAASSDERTPLLRSGDAAAS